ncbi:MAG TPA: hypothetical protein VG298_08860 [Acidimicrobiales bacterium]|nr:hypothetical protein [Acidimicrobiales bacterium]
MLALSTTAEAAKSAGTSQPHAESIDGVPLAPMTSAQLTVCKKFANDIKAPVVCPELLPVPIPVTVDQSVNDGCGPGIGETSCGPAQFQITRQSFFLNQANFKVPTGYIGVTFDSNAGVVPEKSASGGPLGHLVVMEGKSLSTTYQNYPHKGETFVQPAVPQYCANVRTAKPVKVHGVRARLYQCAHTSKPGELQLYEGHELLTWKEDGLMCQVSFHGHSQTNIDLDLAVARASRLVQPTRS